MKVKLNYEYGKMKIVEENISKYIKNMTESFLKGKSEEDINRDLIKHLGVEDSPISIKLWNAKPNGVKEMLIKHWVKRGKITRELYDRVYMKITGMPLDLLNFLQEYYYFEKETALTHLKNSMIK